MARIVALYGSPRRRGNTATLLDRAVEGAESLGVQVDRIFLADLNLSPCLELYRCAEDGNCAIQDDYQDVERKMLDSDGIMLASPIFFYTVTSHTKLLMDRAQCLWVRKHWLQGIPPGQGKTQRKGLFISVGASQGKKLFDGVLLTVKYFFDVFDTALWQSLLYRGLDLKGDVEKHPDYLEESFEKGRSMALELKV